MPAAEKEAASSRPPPKPEKKECNETILLVEDEESLRSLLTIVLRSRGYTVLAAGDGNEAARIAEEHEGPIELLVTDLRMPGMSGRQVAEALIPSRPETRVLFMSGYTNEIVLQHGRPGADAAFLQKPFSPDELAGKIREVLAD